MRWIRAFVAFAVAVFVGVVITPTATSAAPSSRSTVGGSTPAWANASRDVGKRPSTDVVDIAVYLPLRNAAAAESLLGQVSTPGTTSYRRYLTPAQFAQNFAPSNADVAVVTQFLRSAGMTITDVPDNHAYVSASGTIAQANAAFATEVHRYKYKGHVLSAPSRALSVPTSVANSVLSVVGLDASLNQPSKKAPSPVPPPDAFVNAPPCSTYFGDTLATTTPKVKGKNLPYVPCGYTPGQLRGAYGTPATGLTGRGVTVAITDAYAAPTILADANQYATSHGDAAFRSNQFQQLAPKKDYRYGYNDTKNGDLCDERGWYGEETLDVEAVHAIAPDANVLYVAGRSCDDPDLLAALNTIVAGDRADIISNSWGSIGEDTSKQTLRAYHNVFLQAALQGISVDFSSGDDGDDSTDTADGSPAVDFPSSEPLVTAVGGTALAVSSGNKYGWETGWATGSSALVGHAWDPAYPGDWLYGGGGGTSSLFAQPFYQHGKVPATGKRMTPDVSMEGDPQTGMLIGETQTFSDGVRYSEYRIGGTSLSSPLFAGMEALTVQHRGRLGWANVWLYSLGRAAYHDISGPAPVRGVVRVNFNNGVDASDGTSTFLRSFDDEAQSLHVGPGWDNLTGLGSPNGAAFVLAH